MSPLCFGIAYLLYSHVPYHNDAIIKQTLWQRQMQEDFLNKIFTSHFIARVRKGCVGFYCERELEIEHNWNILTPNLWPSRSVFLVLLMLNRSPGVHSAGCWLSLLHLISIFSGPQLIRASKPLRSDVAFLNTSSPTGWNSTGNYLVRRTQLSYIIVRRPLDLWNRMFNRYQAEITVMQFRGHSLPVHQSMSVPWEFFSSSHFISQFPPTRFPLITAIRMCHLLSVHHLGMAFLAGSKGQNTTY